jgi:hypothetical protein
VQAALWDLVWERGGAWSTRLSRRTQADPQGEVVLPLTTCVLEARVVDQPSTTPAALVLTGTVGADGAYADLVARPRYEYRVVITDAASALPVVLLRGYITIRDTVGA